MSNYSPDSKQTEESEEIGVRQRGIYSELLGHSSAEVLTKSSSGPSDSSFRQFPFKIQSTPSARTFRGASSGSPQRSLLYEEKSDVKGVVQPKVMVPYERTAGKPPRRIEVERHKRMYASVDIDKVLVQSGVYYAKYGLLVDHRSGKKAYLPLTVFDDTSLECREPAQWIEEGTDEHGVVSIPARALRFFPSEPDEDGDQVAGGRYVACAVVGYMDGSVRLGNVPGTNDKKPGAEEDITDEAELKEASLNEPVKDDEVTEGRFAVLFDDMQEPVYMHRLHLCFQAENPYDYVRRVALAHKLRRQHEARIRYALYVDAMPTDEMRPLDLEQDQRIMELAHSTKKLRDAPRSNLMGQVNIDYARTVNKIVFDSMLRDSSHPEVLEMVNLPLAELEELNIVGPGAQALSTTSLMWRGVDGKMPPSSGVLQIPVHDFPTHFTSFCFHSFYTKKEAIKALVKVNAQCRSLEEMWLLQCNWQKSKRLEEFKQSQRSCINTLISYLKDKWTSSLKGSIVNSLREVGKGWLNLQERNRDVYNLSKLKKFMRMVNFMMQDSLRSLVQRSIRKYSEFLLKACQFRVAVQDSAFCAAINVEPDWTMQRMNEELQKAADIIFEEIEAKSAKDKGKKKGAPAVLKLPSSRMRTRSQCLFAVELVLAGDGVAYTTKPEDFLKACLHVFEYSIMRCHEIPQLETAVMERLFWGVKGHEPKLDAVRLDEPWVHELYQQLRSKLERSLAPMNDYLATYERHKEFIRLNVNEYVEEWKSQDIEVEELQMEINLHLEAKTHIEEEIPHSMNLGLVIVTCEDVRNKLASKHMEISSKLLDLLSAITKQRCEEINTETSRVKSELERDPEDMNELVKIQEFMETVPKLVASWTTRIQQVMHSFDILDSFKYRLPKENRRLKWRVFGWPKRIFDLLSAKELSLTHDRVRFLEDMKQSQEDFVQELAEAEKKVSVFGQHTDINKLDFVVEKVRALHKKLKDLEKRAMNFNHNESLFNLPATDYRHVNQVLKAFDPYHSLWTVAADWQESHTAWMNDPFTELDANTITEKVMHFNKTIIRTLKAKVLRDNSGCVEIASNIKKEIDGFKQLLPLIVALRNPGMRERHWGELSRNLMKEFQPDESTTLTAIVQEHRLQQYLDVIVRIGEEAGKEYQIESALKKMKNAWSPMAFEVVSYKKTGTFIIKSVEEINLLLDEHVLMTEAMRSSPYVRPFASEIKAWHSTLQVVSEVVENWIKVQAQWMSLQAIFASKDIKKQLPREAKRFQSVDEFWVNVMRNVNSDPRVLENSNISLRAKLEDNLAMLDQVQKRLSDYLDQKRMSFARFFFLSDEELLKILSQTQDPTAVQPHLKKCFESIARLEFDEDTTIKAMFSSKNERVSFANEVDPRGQEVEFWLGQVETEMKAAVHEHMVKAIEAYPKTERAKWVREHIGQTVLNGSQYYWTMEVEKALKTKGLRGIVEYQKFLANQLSDMVELVRGDLSDRERTVMGALIVLDVHAKEVVEKLVERKVAFPIDFEWILQMRYYQQEDQSLYVEMIKSRFPYTYEYLGNSLRLVITPLTDRCYMTLMTALQFHLGGAPEGPAGTGKTETVKDLAKAVAKQCVVFNCSEGLNYRAMGKFFKGLAASGAWSCFDEFNRIDIEVLSVVAQQIMTIWEAVREGVKVFHFEGSDIKLEPTCSVFITMNPGYAGRTELPDNLKALFRPVAMMVPDYALIAEIMLYSFGFDRAKDLARKMVATFKLSSEQLSSQDHYDYGMRAVKTVITRAGILKRMDVHARKAARQKAIEILTKEAEERAAAAQASSGFGRRRGKKTEEKKEEPVKPNITRRQLDDVIAGMGSTGSAAADAALKGVGENEDVLVLRALRDVNVPKFLIADMPLFEGIISDLFPKVEKPEADYGVLMNSIVLAGHEKGLQPAAPFLNKCVQLYETTVVRHGLMMVGPTGGGKTSCIHTLAKALSNLAVLDDYQKVMTHTINPKAVTLPQLYGSSDPVTREWNDGILANVVRSCTEDTTDKRHWVVFDGPVDALWIENMNTVLDDNKKLCLVSGEILQLTPRMTMIFEVEDLKVASPATVSRCGMVYMDPDALSLWPPILSWLEGLHEVFHDLKPRLFKLMDIMIEPITTFIRKHAAEPVPTVSNNLVNSLLKLLGCFFAPLTPESGVQETQSLADRREVFCKHIDAFFIFALTWSVGASTDLAGRKRFDYMVRQLINDNGVRDAPPRWKRDTLAEGEEKEEMKIGRGEPLSVYDCVFDLKTEQWLPWMKSVPSYKFDDRLSYSEVIIPTVDTVRYTFLLRELTSLHHQVLFTGVTGTGKSVNIMTHMRSLPKAVIPVTMIFSAATSANDVEDFLFSKMTKRRAHVFGPPIGKRYLIVIDDMNMPAQEKYFAQPPIELLRQWMDHNGWYNRKDQDFNEIVDISFIGAMGPPGGGRNPVTPRLLRHFNQIAHTPMDDATLQIIYNTIVDNMMTEFSPQCRKLSNKIVRASIEVYNTVSRELLPTPSKSHYTFNLRDLSAVFQGILGASTSGVTKIPEFLRLWIHENSRVFRDRLVDDGDRQKLDGIIKNVLMGHFGAKWEDIMPDHPLFFGDFFDGVNADTKQYEECTDMDGLKMVVEEYLQSYNDEYTAMNLVMFMDAIEHVSRIARVIRQPGGHALLLGVGGSGRQSATRLASFIREFEFFQVETSSKYTVNDWHDELRGRLLEAGLKEQPTVFIFSDTQIIHDEFMQDVNNLLNSGEIPNLFNSEDMDQIFNQCKIDCQRKNIPTTRLNVYNQFIHRVRANLHVVLCMSPMSDEFRMRLRMFPALVNCCTIDWFSDWPVTALRSVAYSVLAGETDVETNPEVRRPTAMSSLMGSIDLRPGEERKVRHSSDQQTLARMMCDRLAIKQPDDIVAIFTLMHSSVQEASTRFKNELRRYNYVTPTSYLEVISMFQKLLRKIRQKVGGYRSKLKNGLAVLRNASEQVAQLAVTLKEKEPRLIIKQKEVKATMAEIEIEQRDQMATKEVVLKQEAEVAKNAAVCKDLSEEAEKNVRAAEPELKKALNALAELKLPDITVVKSFLHPPVGVILTMEATCIMLKHILKIKVVMKNDPDKMGAKIPDYWETAKKQVLHQPKALLDLLVSGYDYKNIPEKTIQQIKPYIAREDFQPKAIAGASRACVAICMWVHAMYKYYTINKEVEPLREKARVTKSRLESVMAELSSARARLEKVNSSLQKAKESLMEGEAEAERLQAEVSMCKRKKKVAETLNNSLKDERERWALTIEQLNNDYANITGDVLVCAGTIAYLGAFTSKYRKEMLDLWRKRLTAVGIKYTPNCTIRMALGDEIEVRKWNQDGLPTDKLSIENGIIMAEARRYPLIIDPQDQASKYLKKYAYRVLTEAMMERVGEDDAESGLDDISEQGMMILKMSDSNFLNALEVGVCTGKWVMIEGVQERVDASMDPLLGQQTISINSQTKVRIGDNMVVLSDDFRLFMVTKLPNPHFAPELQVKVTLLNFTITPAGLEDQMLGTVVARESPALEQKKNAFVESNARMKEELRKIEDRILQSLSESDGDPLEDEDLINQLKVSKSTAEEFQKRVKESEIIEKDIDLSRQSYRPVAVRASVLYFCIADLAMVDPMYQYSLQWFVQLFTNAIAKSKKSNKLSERLENLNSFFTKSLYQNVCRSVFEAHKLMFSFLLCVRLQQRDGNVDEAEWRWLVAGAPPRTEMKKPNYTWLTDNIWTQIRSLSDLPNFKGLAGSVHRNGVAFRRLFDAEVPHEEKMPEPWDVKLNTFQRMLLIKCLRPDKVIPAIQHYIGVALGPEFNDPPQFDLKQSFADASFNTPLIFILSVGADPASRLDTFANDMGFRDKMKKVSLGEGQGVIAEKNIELAMKKGEWVLLQNCHLAASWLPKLQQICEEMQPEHEDFRLWLTSLPTDKFPVSILQNGIKMTNELPKGLKPNLMRTYLQFSDHDLNKCSKPKAFKKLLYALSFFHAVILDRRKYGPLGWNIPYQFTENDLSICVTEIQEFLDMYTSIPFKLIHFLTGHINYGGRVTDDVDRRLIQTILNDFINPGIMADDYKFSAAEEYVSIPTGPREYYLQSIQKMPNTSPPVIFGMHPNADVTSAQQETQTVMTTILSVLPRDVQSGSRSREDIISDLSQTIQGKLPLPWEMEAVQKKFPTAYEESMNTVLVQEAMRYNVLINEIRTSLSQLDKALKGEMVMTARLEAVAQALFTNTVPDQWNFVAYPTLMSLSEWVDDLLARLKFIDMWVDKGMPVVFWISGFFFPQAFLTGTLQNFARKTTKPIDTISFSFHVLSRSERDIGERPTDGVYIQGLHLQGAQWNAVTETLGDSRPKELFTKMPVIWLLPEEHRQKPQEGSVYECPVYKTLLRRGQLSTTGRSTNFVVMVELPTRDDPSKWIKAGVAMFCSLDYCTTHSAES